ncbi:YhcN/YlaJ family sporulation lipoprotein [Oceanobacillus salinisoli]|uniref:YhcN/YlaJ family sporulation lipoprotein n=1 Tax=Oceanobacillus salinisoli TaxID=2678611 RepID=UPI0012E1A6DA|nr:YhcN/YlaJ family sporulation lipoprotein [Oceanobacillus salinisoli]
MKKIIILILTVSSILFISACNVDTDNTMEERDQIADELDPNRDEVRTKNQDMNQQLGYVHYSKDEINEDAVNNREAKIDRPEMADMITRLILVNEGFEEVATLVTDQEVLVAYESEENSEQENTAQIARKTAESVMPSFYEIYVSDNESLIYDIQSLHNSTSRRNYDQLINQLIKEMQKSPQGHHTSNDM